MLFKSLLPMATGSSPSANPVQAPAFLPSGCLTLSGKCQRIYRWNVIYRAAYVITADRF